MYLFQLLATYKQYQCLYSYQCVTIIFPETTALEKQVKRPMCIITLAYLNLIRILSTSVQLYSLCQTLCELQAGDHGTNKCIAQPLMSDTTLSLSLSLCRQLSRHLVGLWVTGNPTANALLHRVLYIPHSSFSLCPIVFCLTLWTPWVSS